MSMVILEINWSCAPSVMMRLLHLGVADIIRSLKSIYMLIKIKCWISFPFPYLLQNLNLLWWHCSCCSEVWTWSSLSTEFCTNDAFSPMDVESVLLIQTEIIWEYFSDFNWVPYTTNTFLSAILFIHTLMSEIVVNIPNTVLMERGI